MPEITANGIRIHYQRVGRGTTPVVMLHGLMIDDLSSLYFTTAPALADLADVILYDLRGHGRSEQPPTATASTTPSPTSSVCSMPSTSPNPSTSSATASAGRSLSVWPWPTPSGWPG